MTRATHLYEKWLHTQDQLMSNVYCMHVLQTNHWISYVGTVQFYNNIDISAYKCTHTHIYIYIYTQHIYIHAWISLTSIHWKDWDDVKFPKHSLTHLSQVTPFGDMHLSQHWFRQGPDGTKPLPEPVLDSSSVVPCNIYQQAIALKMPRKNSRYSMFENNIWDPQEPLRL